jgi:hypothetical protein
VLNEIDNDMSMSWMSSQVTKKSFEVKKAHIDHEWGPDDAATGLSYYLQKQSNEYYNRYSAYSSGNDLDLQKQVRYWKLSDKENVKGFYKYVEDEISPQMSHSGYKVKFKGDFVQGNMSFKDQGIIETDTIFIEVKKSSSYSEWIFWNDQIPQDERCE